MTDKLREALEHCIKALESCYDVVEYPATGETVQAKALEFARAALAAPSAEPVATDAQDAKRWRFISDRWEVRFSEGRFTHLNSVVSEGWRNSLNASVDRMMVGDWGDARNEVAATAQAAAGEMPPLPSQTVPIEEHRRLLARCIELGEKIAGYVVAPKGPVPDARVPLATHRVLSKAEVRRLYDNSPEYRKDVASFAAFARLWSFFDEVTGIAAHKQEQPK